MLKNHILLAFRHLKKEKGYTLSSIVGLALAFAACFFTFSFVFHEYTADRQFADRDLTYKLQANDTIDSPVKFNSMPISNAQYMEDHFPEVSLAVPIYQEGSEVTAEIQGKYFVEKLWAYTEPEVLQLFETELFDVRQTVKEGTVLLSETAAQRFFGNEDPVGKVIGTEEGDYVVAGTFQDFPSNAQLQINVFCIPLPSKEMQYRQGLVYLKVLPDVNIPELLVKVDKESDDMDRFLDVIRYTLVSVNDVYLTSSDNTGIQKSANKDMVEDMAAISLIILFIAAFNIVNLTQVKTLFRGREVGVKKVLGISTGQLMTQFLAEAALVVLLSGLLAISFIQLGRQELLGYLQMNKLSIASGGSFLLSLMVVIVLLLGIMQTLLFRKVMPRDVIAGKLKLGEKKWLLKGFVGVQFLIACTLVGGALLVNKQKQYMLSRPVGFDVDDLWYVRMYSSEDLRLLRVKTDEMPGVQNSTISSGLPFVTYGGMVHEDDGKMEFIPFISIDEHFTSTLGISFVNEPTVFPDSGVFVNQTLMAREDLDLKKALGESVVGEVADFHFGKLSNPIRAMALEPDKDVSKGFMTMRITSSAVNEVKSQLKEEWEALYPAYPFELFSLKENYVDAHKKEVELANVLTMLSMIAVCISGIGLASLTGFFVRKRFKEIAIRKVLGATIEQVIRQVNAGYLGWIGGAIVLSMGVIYYFGSEWLASYSYATEIGFWVLAGPSVMLVVIAAAIMILQSWKTARTNPVEALRTE
ncbi:MAG: FtsX-like permease family protein [Imperialibacter sp.]|uniref:ABC transporter permease n=1 Tax=Imperialibacter sp. TaxID=2038411 RepID=UPI0032F06460